jgi:hypothetical protein
MLALAGLALVITTIGWIRAASTNPIDTSSLAERLESCDGLTLASESEECASAIEEFETLLVSYQRVLEDITIPATPADDSSTTTPTAAPGATLQ